MINPSSRTYVEYRIPAKAMYMERIVNASNDASGFEAGITSTVVGICY